MAGPEPPAMRTTGSSFNSGSSSYSKSHPPSDLEFMSGILVSISIAVSEPLLTASLASRYNSG